MDGKKLLGVVDHERLLAVVAGLDTDPDDRQDKEVAAV